MALPYVGLSMAPRLLDRLPKPGAWMETLKQFFAFPMFATAVWLVWVFGQQTGNGGVAMLLFGLLLLGMAAWVAHRWSDPTLSRTVTLLTRGASVVMIAGAIGAAVLGASSGPASASTSGASTGGGTAETAEGAEEAWTAFSPQRVDSLRAAGRPVFVDFTAAWCLTCQVNKRTVLNTDAVQQAFEARDVALLKADWTNRDSEITKALRSHGRSGVPVYVLYAGDGSEPTLLPEVLTQDIVTNALDDLSADASS
jgi:thiol:disulfide interchange protein DsbD